MWREREVEETGEIVRFKRFEDFVATPPLEGLGASVQLLKNIVRDDTETLDLLDRALKGKQGERTDLVDNINEVSRPDGTSREAALRRLRKDRPDLHAKVLAGEMSAHAAMKEAGFRKQRSPLEELQRWWDKADDTTRTQFLLWLKQL